MEAITIMQHREQGDHKKGRLRAYEVNEEPGKHTAPDTGDSRGADTDRWSSQEGHVRAEQTCSGDYF